MSYEGYELFVCANGHKWSWGAFSYIKTGEKDDCPHCEAKAVWSCAIDQTNCEYIEPTLEMVEPPPLCKCCGQATGAARYKIPGPEIEAVYVGPDDGWSY